MRQQETYTPPKITTLTPNNYKLPKNKELNGFFMEKQNVIGTNCFNCLYISKEETPVNPSELNEQGGINPENDEAMEKAQEADLITLPGIKTNVTDKRFCNNKKVLMFVTSQMCCAYWDNKDVQRPWEKKIPAPEYLDQLF